MRDNAVRRVGETSTPSLLPRDSRAKNSIETASCFFGRLRQAHFELGAVVEHLCQFDAGVGVVGDFRLDLRQQLERRAEADVHRRLPFAGAELGDEGAADRFVAVGSREAASVAVAESRIHPSGAVVTQRPAS